MNKYLISWTEHHQIVVSANNEQEAFEDAETLSGQKDTCVDRDSYRTMIVKEE